jgi:hypothetical protein
MTQTVILRGQPQRDLAKQLIDKAPVDAVVKISEAKRTTSQNNKLWALLSDISRHKPEGRRHIPEIWKCVFMASCGHEVQFEHGLDGRPFPVGFRSSHLTKSQMSDLIEYVISYGQQHGVIWSETFTEY